MKGAESLAFLFVNVPIGGPESRGWTSGRVAAREKMMFEHMYLSLPQSTLSITHGCMYCY